LGRNAISTHGSSNTPESSHSLARTRTTPGRAYTHRLREGNRSLSSVVSRSTTSSRPTTSQAFGSETQLGRLGIRKMRSAGDLKASPAAPIVPPPHSATAAGDRGFRSAPMTMAFPGPSPSRSAHESPFQEHAPEIPKDNSRPRHTPRQSVAAAALDSPPSSSATDRRFTTGGGEQPSSLRSQMREAKEKFAKWGFLRKISMGKMKIDSSTSSRTSPQNPPGNISISHGNTSAQLDARSLANATGVPDTFASPDASIPLSAPLPASPLPAFPLPASPLPASPLPASPLPASPLPASPVPTHSPDALVSPSLSAPSPSFTKRRSFLPLDRVPVADRPISDEAASTNYRFDEVAGLNGLSVPNSSPNEGVVKSVQDNPEEAFEGYNRALRSVMAYLRDMNDLSSSTNPPVPGPYMPSHEEQPGSTLHSRRPTLGAIDQVSEAPPMDGSAPGPFRQTESMLSSRTSSQTFSVVTSASNDSGGDRRLNDKGKRAMVVREIIE
jgi:hypothetical protein